jgi:D-alanyl-D-alanine carboxypeptidase/D-alanyl-D-alanine-endopeptidase (penicillin-binding protein 4)
VLIVDRKTGEVLYERAADERFRPASVTKLFSTAAALIDLGPDYRFQTPVRRRGEVDESGTLKGDLILVASGDPSLGGRTGPDGSMLYTDSDHSYAGGHLQAKLVEADPRAGLDSLARQVEAAGIRALEGEVLIDDRLFAPAPSTGSGPSQITPIVLNDNVIDVVVTPGDQADEPASLRLVPETSYAEVDNQVRTAPEGTRPSIRVESAGPRGFAVRGRLPVGHEPVVKIWEVDDPASFARALFIEALRCRGVRVAASPLGRNDTDRLPPPSAVAELPQVAEYTSPPFREYARVILKVSQNLHASALPVLLGVRRGQPTLGAGLRREGELLRGLGLDIDTISFGGGAGGSNADLVTPRGTVQLLRAMAARPDSEAYEAALPVLGRDGTLAKAVGPDSPAWGHVRAKTGTYWVESGLTGRAVMTSKSLAGYMETSSGRPLIFAFFLNDVPLAAPSDDVSDATSAANRLLGRLCEVVYDDARPAR